MLINTYRMFYILVFTTLVTTNVFSNGGSTWLKGPEKFLK